jgi:ABC-type multidrug transport system ATPase subunit
MQEPKSLKGRKLLVRYGRSTILHHVDFAVRGGELVGILGPSGSGKSTLLMALSGFRPAKEGGVTFGGRDLYQDFEALKQQIGFVPQDDVVPTNLKVEKVLKYAAELRLPHFTPEARQGRVEGVLRKLGLSEKRALRVSKLSGGQRKRVSVAVELLARPPLLFADEPTSGLDPALEGELMQQLKEMSQEGRAVVVTTHIMSSLSLLDIACVMHGGRVAYFGPPGLLKEWFGASDFVEIYQKLAAQPPEAWARRFSGSPLCTEHLHSRLKGA